MPGVPTIFKTAAGRADYLATYDAALALWPVPYESLRVKSRYGTTHLIASGPTDAPPLLLPHGLGTSATMWYPNTGEFSQHFRTYAIDIVGQPGKSELRSRQNCAQWLLDVLAGLDLQQVDLVGLSLGGWLALNLALIAPERVSQLVLLSPVGGILPFRRGVVIKLLLTALFPLHSHITQLVLQPFFGEPIVLNPCFERQCLLGVEQFRGWTTTPIPSTFSVDELSHLAMSALLLVAEHKIFYRPQAALARARQLLPNLEAEVIPHAGHALPMEQPALVNELVLRFLLRHSASCEAHLRHHIGLEQAPPTSARTGKS